MEKDRVVDEMCEVINNMNRQVAWQNGIPSDQVNDLIMRMQPELKYGNGLIYDRLVEIGAISE